MLTHRSPAVVSAPPISARSSENAATLIVRTSVPHWSCSRLTMVPILLLSKPRMWLKATETGARTVSLVWMRWRRCASGCHGSPPGLRRVAEFSHRCRRPEEVLLRERDLEQLRKLPLEALGLVARPAVEQVTSVEVSLDGLKIWATNLGDGLHDGLVHGLEFDPE